jgi:hypothetical protein
MRLIVCEQGSPEWLQARCGVITASKFRDALDKTAKGQPTAKSCTYAAQVALERISGSSTDENFVSWQMRRGTEIEPEARRAYEVETGNVANESGVVLTDDARFGYSTDGFVGDEGCVEIKCLVSAEKLIDIWGYGELSEFRHQMQGGLWLTGRKWCDFVLYAPQLAPIGKELFVKRIARDEEFIAKMELDLLDFARRVDENEAILRRPVAA